jgi:6-hydroxycyclohex-1-ene-1-carbonyl-CoA dehydrogenase
MAQHGAALTIDPSTVDLKQLRKQVRAFADARGVPTWRTKIFETSGTPQGQATAFGLLGHGGYLSVVGYTPKSVELRFSNLMAFDATAQGNWGCLPEYYPAIVDLVLKGRIALAPFIERRPLASINDVFEELHAGRVTRRLVLIPES